MRRSSMMAAALAIFLPAAGQAHEAERFGEFDFRSHAPQRQGEIAPYGARGSAALHIVPPRDGAVLVFDGPRLIGQLQQPGAVHVEAGRFYAVVALQGELFLWGGSVWAARPSVHLKWGQEAAPSWTYGQAPPRWRERPRSTERSAHRELLHALERRTSGWRKLAVLRNEARGRSFTTEQADEVLDRFPTERLRLEALEILQGRLLDPENRFRLTRHFRYAETRHQAIEVLHRQDVQRSKHR